jgi:ABC-2 type transport system ATP-binding protein
MERPVPEIRENDSSVDFVVQTSELTREFGTLVAVDHVSLKVRRSEIFGLIGPNGAGKSTLIKMLTTLLPPSSGTAIIAGCDIVRAPQQVRQHIGYVPQLLSADGSLTAYENLLLSARLYGIPRQERARRIDGALRRMGLAAAANRLVGQFSGGMIRRLEIAQSLLHRPAVLFLDEPTVGLDPAARETVWERILDLRNSFQRTMIVTSHHMDEIDQFCDRIAMIDRGRIIAVGTPKELKAKIAPDATLDDVFVRLLPGVNDETEGSYGDVRRARRASREHG